MERTQGVVGNLLSIVLMTSVGACNLGFTSVGDLPDGGMTFPTAKLTMGRVEVLLFVDMEHFESIRPFKPYKSRILMADEASPLI